jgi:hypothetical protein
MAHTATIERHVSDLTDRRRVVGRGGRRGSDYRASECDLRIADRACRDTQKRPLIDTSKQIR